MRGIETEEEQAICEMCGGDGGYDRSRDCEVYDDWVDCPYCNGTGKDEL